MSRLPDPIAWRLGILVVPAISLFLLKGCSSFSGSDGVSKPPPAAVPDAESPLAPSLGCPFECLPPAPANWSGPSAVYVGPAEGRPTTCSGPYPRLEVEAHDTASAAAAECTCAAGDASAGACLVTGRRFNQTGCKTELPSFTQRIPGDPGCVVPSYASVNIAPPVYEPGACSFEPPKVTRPPVVFGAVEVACGLAQVAACESRPDCIKAPGPSAPFGRLCIFTAGERPCPSEDYSVRFVGHRTVVDDRDCEACTGTSTGTCDPLGVRAANADCSSATNTLEAGACKSSPAGIDLRGVGPFDAGCQGSSAPRGAISSADPITFCCNL